MVTYENRVVAFIDILGFADHLKKTLYTNIDGSVSYVESGIEILESSFSRIRQLLSIDEPIEGAAQSRQVTQFSDSIVISFDQQEDKELKYLLGELLHLQVELVKSGLLIRGGIAYGPLIHNEKVLFGPAMVQAYQLESRAANSPRIILPKSLYDSDSSFKNLIQKGEINEIEKLVSHDEDDFFYLDYFDKCQDPANLIFPDDNEYINHFVSLKKIINEGLKNSNPGIYSKYGWMKTKWNNTLKYYKNNAGNDNLLESQRMDLLEYFQNETQIESAM